MGARHLFGLVSLALALAPASAAPLPTAGAARPRGPAAQIAEATSPVRRGVRAPVLVSPGNGHGADLVVHVKIEDLGTPPHILVGASGTARRFRIDVTTENRGDRKAGRSRTSLSVDDGGLTKVYRWNVKSLESKEAAGHTVIVEGLTPDLGFTEARARANAGNVVPETNKGNNAQSKQIAVEPREWDVPEWTAEDKAFGIDNLTRAGSDFYFRFQKYDGGFVYQAFGPVTDTPKSYPGCAPVDGSKTITQTPWVGSSMKIDPDLRGYRAFVSSSGNFFFATCHLGPSSFQIQVGFIDLTTGTGSPRKKPEYVVLTASATVPAPGGGTRHVAWTFKAHLPKR